MCIKIGHTGKVDAKMPNTGKETKRRTRVLAQRQSSRGCLTCKLVCPLIYRVLTSLVPPSLHIASITNRSTYAEIGASNAMNQSRSAKGADAANDTALDMLMMAFNQIVLPRLLLFSMEVPGCLHLAWLLL